MSTTIIAQLRAIVSVDISQFDKGMNRANAGLSQFENNTDRASKSSKSLGTALQVLAGNVLTQVTNRLLDAGRAAFRFGAETADAASDIAESSSKVSVLLGASVKQAEDFAATSAKSYGVSKSAALEYIGIFANLMRSQGQARAATAQYSVQLVKTAADLASFNNTSIEDALDALRSGLVGESEPLRRFGVQLSAAAIESEAMRLGLVKSTKEITTQQKQLAILSIIKRQTAAASGDFARTADGAANSTRILSARFQDLKAKVGEVTLPIKLRLIKIIQELFDYLDRNQSKIRTFFSNVSDGIEDAVDTGKALLTVFGSLPDGVKNTAGSVTKLVAAFAPLAAIGSNIAGMVVSFKQLSGIQAGVNQYNHALTRQVRSKEQKVVEAQLVKAQASGVGIEAAQAALSVATTKAALETQAQARAIQSVAQAYRDAATSGTKFAGVQAGMSAIGNNIKVLMSGIVASVAPFALSIGIVIAAIAAATLAWFKLKADIEKSKQEIARYQQAEITQDDVRKAAKGLPNGLEKIARTNAQSNIDDAKNQIEKLRADISGMEQDLSSQIERRKGIQAELSKLTAGDTSRHAVELRRIADIANRSLSQYDQARANLTRQELRLKTSQKSIAKLDATDTKRANVTAAKQAAEDAAAAQKAAAEAAAKAAQDAAKAQAEAARKAREEQFKSLVKDVQAQRNKLRQLTASSKGQLDAANLDDIAGKYDKINVRSGVAGRLAAEYLRLADAIRKAENAAAEKARVTSALSGLYDTVRQKVLLLRDSSIENTVAVEIFKKVYTSLTDAEKNRIKGIISLQVEEKRLTDADEAAKKSAEEWKSKTDSLNDAFRDAQLELQKYNLRVEGVEDAANPAILALERFKIPLYQLPIGLRLVVFSIAAFNKALADQQATDAHKKRIKDLANEYQSLIYQSSEWGRFLIQREGTDFEAGIDPVKLQRLREEFEGIGRVGQAQGLERLRQRVQDMQTDLGELTFKTTESRIAWEVFGTSIDKLAPEIAAEVRKASGEFDRLQKKAKELEKIRAVGQVIRDSFRGAFEAALLSGENFFKSLTNLFKQAIARIIADKAADAVARQAEKWLESITGKKDEDGGSKSDTKSTYSAMSRAINDAKKTPTPVIVTNAAALGTAQASQLAPIISQLMPRMGAGIPGMTIPSMGGGFGASSIASWGVGQLFGSAAGAATAGLFPLVDGITGGAISKGIGSVIGGIGDLFGGLFADGGTLPSGKWGVVGERGPELVFSGSAASQIMSNKDSRAFLANSGGGVQGDTYNVQNMTINDAADRDRIKAWNRQRTQRKLRIA